MRQRIPVLRISIFLNVIFIYFLMRRNKKTSQSPPYNTEIHRSNWTDRIAKSVHRSGDFHLQLNDLGSIPRIGQRGNYWVLYNYVRAEKVFGDFDSVTYTTHSDFTFLDNLEPLLERWMGPVSIALYSPGSDFKKTLERISYLRECTQSPLVKAYVTFHIFFDSGHFPLSKIPQELSPVDCDAPPEFGDNVRTYRKTRNLVYPVNVARNIAREMSTTYFVLASDIELYPSPNLIHQFLEMVQTDDFKILKKSANPKVFVLPIFEVDKSVDKLPEDKTELQGLLRSELAVSFHKFVCLYCHKIPRQEQWIKAKQKPKLGIFHVGKREGDYIHWEPIYIGTKFEPNYDERLSWEGQKDKMTQVYIKLIY